MIEGRESKTGTGVLSYGMVGGGPGSFIGDVHRKAAAFDGRSRLAAGCFSRDFENTLATGGNLNLDSERLYRNYGDMAEKEAARPDRIDFAVIVSPNAAHYPAAREFLLHDINVVCDKPLAISPVEAEELARLARERNLLFCVTYTYSGYPMVKQARAMVRRGDIGKIRIVMGEYPQDWLAFPLEKEGQKQAAWRADPAQAGRSNCTGDIGSHIEHTAAYITGLRIKSLAAHLDIFGRDRCLDDNAEVLVRFDNGASGVYWSSQVAIGHDNGLRIRVYGTKGSIEWEQENPNVLRVAMLGRPVQIMSRGGGYLYPEASGVSRIPAGHTEGYYEAFANIYAAFTGALQKKLAGLPLTDDDLDFPCVEDGVRGVRFINACVDSAEAGSAWVEPEDLS